MNENNTYSSLFSILFSKKKSFIIIALISIVASTIFSSPFFISPKYKSEAALYPSNLENYSSESSTEQLLQFFFGNDIRDSIIDKYDLGNHYDIDSASDGYLHNLHREYNGNVTIKKTNFESVQIEVMDTDPLIARDITQELINQVNNKIRLLHQSKAKEIIVIRENEMNNKKELIDTLEAQIRSYSTKYGLLDYIQQSREVTAGYMDMLLNSKKGKEMQKAEDLYENLKQEGSHFHDLHHQLNLAREDFNKILIGYENAIRDANKRLTYTNVIVFPEEADKKSYPVRWLIVLFSVLGALFFAFTLLLFYNRLKHN
jgi:capsule polysaccharide export protein KpsE/RkpR